MLESPPGKGEVLAGLAKVEITWPAGVLEKKKNAKPLYARALLLQSGREKYLLMRLCCIKA